jgi:PD-(D/E)XK nuclease superfamily protein
MTSPSSGWRDQLATMTGGDAAAVLIDAAQDLVRVNGRHQYDVEISGEWTRVPSVTQITSLLDKPALVHWAGNQQLEEDIETAWRLLRAGLGADQATAMGRDVFESAFREASGEVRAWRKTSSKAKDLGGEVHALIEHYLGVRMGIADPGNPPAASDAAMSVYAGFERWARESRLQPIRFESKVFSLKHRYAGRMDLLGYCEERLEIIDWKTVSDSFFKKREPYDEHVLQVTGYAEALREMGAPLPGRRILYIPKTEGHQIEPVKVAGEHAAALEAFLALRRVHAWKEAA